LAQVTTAKVEPKKGEKLTVLDKFSALSLRVFVGPARRISGAMPSLRDDILKSNLRTTPEALVSLALMVLTITSVATAVTIVVSILLNFEILALVVVAPPIAFLLILNAPKISQSSRSYAIENELPFMVGYMEVLASGGVSPISTLRRFASLDKILPASSKEAKLILVDTDVFGIDPITALEKAANTNPNKTFSEFLYGYTTVLKTGGDSQTYVSTKMREIMDARSQKIRRTSDTIGTLAEAYLTVTAVLGISLFTLYQVQAVLAHNAAGLASLELFSFLIVPMISAMFVWLLDGMGTKQPYVDYRPYKWFAVFLPIGALVYFLPLPLNLPIKASVALLVTVAVPAFYAIRYSRERMGLEAKLPDFIRDVAESRKIGLAPEASIEALGGKNYSRLSKPVRKMGAQLSWGLALSKVVSTFIESVNSWLTKVVGALMLEVVDVGGGTVRSFSAMADFTSKINELEKEKRSMLRPYVFVTYMAAILVVVTTFLMVYFIFETGNLPGGFRVAPTIPTSTIDLLLLAAVFDSWVIGLVAGKMGESSLSDGFKHAMILTLISLVTIIVSAGVLNLSL
jgi:archaeal flagellar protein FlaJ